MQRYSKKRQAILDCLRATDEHPTAEWIYERLHPMFPTLSLATVYRNLLQLKDAGLIRSLGTVLGQERFDAQMNCHTHAICVKCGKVLDVYDVNVPEETIALVRASTGYDVWQSNLRFSGICESCQKENQKNFNQ